MQQTASAILIGCKLPILTAQQHYSNTRLPVFYTVWTQNTTNCRQQMTTGTCLQLSNRRHVGIIQNDVSWHQLVKSSYETVWVIWATKRMKNKHWWRQQPTSFTLTSIRCLRGLCRLTHDRFIAGTTATTISTTTFSFFCLTGLVFRSYFILDWVS